MRDDYCGFWKRARANALDGTLLGILLTLIGIIFKDTTATIVQIVLWLTYMIGFKGTRGSTPGYHALGMKLVAVTGDELAHRFFRATSIEESPNR